MGWRCWRTGLGSRDLLGEVVETVEGAWGERLASEDREVDLGLVELGRVRGQVDEDEIRLAEWKRLTAAHPR